MADSKLADLTAATTLSALDVLYTVRDPAGTPVDRKITADNAATALAGLAGWTLIDEEGLTVTSGDITLNTTSIADLTATQMTLTGAVTGDVVKYHASFRVSSVAQTKGFSAYTYPSGTRTNPFGAGIDASLSTLGGFQAWLATSVAAEQVKGGTARRVLVSGDIASGNVIVGIATAGTSTTARTLHAQAGIPLEVHAELWRPPT